MGFSIRSELASYARLKRRCYFLFVISYGGLLAGLTYAAMTHQSPPLWIGLIPGAALSVPLLLLPTQSWLPCLFHVLLGVVFAPIICARREADLSLIEAVELGAVAGLALIYPFYILCSTLEKEGTLKKYAPDQFDDRKLLPLHKLHTCCDCTNVLNAPALRYLFPQCPNKNRAGSLHSAHYSRASI